jgi:glutaredoxin-related protein
MNEMLRAIQRKEEGLDAAGDTHKVLRQLERRKVHYLNNVIFPSMANVVYFLEMVSKNPELQEEFDDDVLDLLGLRITEEMKNKGGNDFVIARLTRAVIDWTERPSNYEHKRKSSFRTSNFRLAAMAVILQMIFYKAIKLSTVEMGGEFSNIIIKNDFGRAWLWAKLFTKNIEQEVGDPHRPTNF